VILAFFFVAERKGVSVEDVRAMPAVEFFRWLRYFGFEDSLDRIRKGAG